MDFDRKYLYYGGGALGVGGAGFTAWRVYERNKLKVILTNDPAFQGMDVGLTIAKWLPFLSLTTADSVKDQAATELMAIRIEAEAAALQETVPTTGIKAIDTALAIAQQAGIDLSPLSTIVAKKNPDERTFVQKTFSTLAMISLPVALALSYQRNKSVPWAIGHGIIALPYVTYRAIEYGLERQSRSRFDW